LRPVKRNVNRRPLRSRRPIVSTPSRVRLAAPEWLR